MSDAHGAQQFYYPTLIAGFVTKVYPIDPQDRRFYVDAIPMDFRGLVVKAQVFGPPGFYRHLRRGQSVLIGYVNGNAQWPIVIAHTPNNESVDTYKDPMPKSVQNPDDLVLHHDETGAFLRFRSVNSTASKAGQDGSPCLFDVSFRSGAILEISEYNPTGYPLPPPAEGQPPNPEPPAPPRAKFTLSMPSGESLVVDEPSEGKATLALSFAEGDRITRDQDGNWKIDTSTNNGNVTVAAGTGTVEVDAKQVNVTGTSQVVITSPDVEVGGTGGQELAFKSDVQALKTYLDSHMHTGVQTGGGVSGVPSQQAPAPVGTVNTKAI